MPERAMLSRKKGRTPRRSTSRPTGMEMSAPKALPMLDREPSWTESAPRATAKMPLYWLVRPFSRLLTDECITPMR